MNLQLKLILTVFAFSVISVDADFRTSIGDWSYLYHSDKLSWDDATSICKTHGMNLITIDTPTQFKNVLQLIDENHLNGQTFWTSGTDLGHENIFVWTSNGQLFDYVPWHSNEPNSWQGNSEDCVTLRLKNNKFGLNDERCNAIFDVICSVELI